MQVSASSNSRPGVKPVLLKVRGFTKSFPVKWILVVLVFASIVGLRAAPPNTC